jgi:hypothetical protein
VRATPEYLSASSEIVLFLVLHAPNCCILVMFQISGTPACVERAKLAVEERCKELEAERKDRILKSFELKARNIFTNFIPVQWDLMLVFYASFMFEVKTFNFSIHMFTFSFQLFLA